MKNKEKFNILILCGLLFLSACGASDESQADEENEISMEEPVEETGSETIYETEQEEETSSIEETETAQESEDDEEWTDTFYVPADELQGNYLGYSYIRLPRTASITYYEQDMPYLLDEDMVGKGIYISDYMCETEVFLGNILKDVVTNRGTVSDENRQYFTENALQQLADTNWESLDTEWEPDLYIYDRYYEMNPVSGGGYRFFYHFYPNQEEIRKEEPEEETNEVNIMLYADGSGRICEIASGISVEPARLGRIEAGILPNGLFDDDYNEQIIKDGSPCHEDMVWDFERHFRWLMYPDEVYEQDNEGMFASGYVCVSAENLADIFLHVMRNRGADAEKYEEWFEYDNDFSNFTGTDWESLGEDWIVDEKYDCFLIDCISDAGWAGFQFYFYPDFKSMGVDTAKMVVINCYVGVSYGLIFGNDISIFPISEEEYQAVKQKQEESRTLVVEKGNVLSGTTEVAIPILDRKVEYMLISEFDPDSVAVEHSSRKVKEEIWGFTDAAEAGDYLAQKFLKDFEENNVWKGEINRLNKDKSALYDELFAIDLFMEDGWKADGEYDCYCVKPNEAEGCMHLQYYFYPERTSEEQTAKILVIDVYFSEEGIEYMGVNQFRAE